MMNGIGWIFPTLTWVQRYVPFSKFYFLINAIIVLLCIEPPTYELLTQSFRPLKRFLCCFLNVYVVVQFFPLVQFFSELVQNTLNWYNCNCTGLLLLTV